METDMEVPNYPSTHSNHSTGCDGELNLFDKFERMQENVFRNVEQNFSNPNSKLNSKVYSYSSSYSSNTDSDGLCTIIERKSESVNGDKKQTINAYKKMPDGKTVPLSEEKMVRLEKFTGLQIEN